MVRHVGGRRKFLVGARGEAGLRFAKRKAAGVQ
jgi:hypothetical protein